MIQLKLQCLCKFCCINGFVISRLLMSNLPKIFNLEPHYLNILINTENLINFEHIIEFRFNQNRCCASIRRWFIFDFRTSTFRPLLRFPKGSKSTPSEFFRINASTRKSECVQPSWICSAKPKASRPVDQFWLDISPYLRCVVHCVDFDGVMKAQGSKKLRSKRDVHSEKINNSINSINVSKNFVPSSRKYAIVLISKPLCFIYLKNIFNTLNC